MSIEETATTSTSSQLLKSNDNTMMLELMPQTSYQTSLPTNSVASQDCKDKFSDDSKEKAGRTRAGETRCLEPNCIFRCVRIPLLRNHLEEVHGIQQDRKMFAFDTEEEFKVWLAEVEREARCTYMRRRGWQMNKNGSITACFYCHRGGAYTSMATKKQTKAQGSCKTGVECTSSVKVIMWGSDVKGNNRCFKKPADVKPVQVEAYLQHYGHNLDLNHARITKVEKATIAKKLNDGISRHKILDEVRSTLDTSVTPHRLHLLSLQDIYNIEKKEGITAKKAKITESGTTVQAWIEKMQASEDNPVLLIKYQQEKASEACSCLSTDDFILVLQTPLQLMMLQKYGPHQCVCIDITQGEPGPSFSRADPNFYLLALEVIIPIPNALDEVFPVAWFVSNRKDEAVIEIFLSRIKNNMSDLTLTPSHLMVPPSPISSGSDWFDVWTSIFGSGPRKLICSWHVLAEWRRQTKKISTSQPLEGTRLLTNLTTILNETNIAIFVQLMQGFMEDLSKNENTLSHLHHFENYYSKQPEAWARAYRTDAVHKTTTYFEQFHHRVGKHVYHEGFKRKQLDVLIKTLLKHSRDKALSKLRQCFRQTCDSTIRRMTVSKHWNSTMLPINFVTPHEESHSWTVMAVLESMRAVEAPHKAGEPLVVKKVAVEYIVRCTKFDGCPARLRCSYRCEHCAVCSHHFVCTCHSEKSSNAIPNSGLQVLCEHCHLVCRYLKKQNRTVDSLFMVTHPEERHPLEFDEIAAERIIDIDKLTDTETPKEQLVVYVETDDPNFAANSFETNDGNEEEKVLPGVSVHMN